jgi:hypothetical protein
MERTKMTTNSKQHDQHDRQANTEPDKQDTKLERLVKHIEPPGREVTDDDLKNPGEMTPGATPTDNRS